MQALTLMTILWIIAIAAFTALMVYRGHLTQHETDELFLDDAADDSNRKHEHDEIVAKVNFIQPFCQGTGGAAALITMAIVGIAIARAIPNIRF